MRHRDLRGGHQSRPACPWPTTPRYNIDLDLITRGSGFGYYGFVVTNVIYATFTFIFFALAGSIMAQGLQLGPHIPMWLGYTCSTLVIYGM